MNPAISQRTIGNAGVLLLGSAVETVLQLAFLVIAGRELGPLEFGFYGYLLAWVTFAAAVVHWGLPVIAVREIAQRPAETTAIFAAVFRIRAMLALLLFLMAAVVALLSPLSAGHRLAVWLAFAYLLGVPFEMAYFFDARQQSRWDVPGRLAGRLVSIGALVLLWRTQPALTVWHVALCSTLFLFVNGGVGWLVARRLGGELRPLAPTYDTSHLLSVSVPVVWSNVMTLAYSQSQTILVKWLSTAVETGYNALATRLFLPILIFRGVVHRVLLPVLSEAGTDRAALTARLESVFPALALLFMPLTVLLLPAIELALVPLFGVDYAGAVLPLQIIVAHLFLSGAGSLFGTSLLVTGDARTPAVGLTAGCVCSVAFSILLIPRFGAVGAAWGTVAGEWIAVLYPLPRFLRVLRPAIGPRLLRIAAVSLFGVVLFFVLARLAMLPPLGAFAIELGWLGFGLRLIGEITPARLQSARDLLRWPGGAR